MKKVIVVVLVFLGAAFSMNAQDTMTKEDKMMKEEKMMKDKMSVISLEQTPGAFTQKGLTVSAGTYVFEIANNGVDHNVGFVLVKQGEDISKPENHIQTAYVTEAVAPGAKQKSKPTTLEKGTYVYFCPLNPTATDNTLVVQ